MKNCPGHPHSNPKHFSRRDFLKLAGLTAVGAALAACQPGEATPTDETVTTVDEKKPKAEKPMVAISKADSYDRKLIKEKVQEMIEQIGGLSDILAHGNRVAIKTNLTGGTSAAPLPGIPEIESYLTHPEVVRAIGELLRDSGVKDLFIVEAVYEKASWPTYGYTDMAKELGATLVDLTYADPYKDFAKTASSSNPFIYDEFIFNPILNEIDAFVSVSKMKCHNTAGVTHTMKNLFGLVPYRFYTLNKGDMYRSGFHGPADETRKRLPQVIMDLNAARPVTLSIVDGVWTSEAGEGPWVPAMTQIKPGVMFAGKNPVATDAIATAAMGFDPTAEYPDAPFVHANNHINIAASLGWGTNKVDEIKVVGEKLKDITMQFTPSY